MFEKTKAFRSFSTNDLTATKAFYGDILGLFVEEYTDMNILSVHLAHGGEIMIYPKDNHIPATYTVLNFSVDNIDTAVDALIRKGISFEQYSGEIETDEKGVSRGNGPSIAWFKDPGGNILSVLEESPSR